MSLELEDTDDLLLELFSRFDHAVFSGFLTTNEKEREHLVRRRWKGNSMTCAGLCQELSISVIGDWHEESLGAAGDFAPDDSTDVEPDED